MVSPGGSSGTVGSELPEGPAGYELLHELGRGSFARVYKGRGLLPGDRHVYALKLVSPRDQQPRGRSDPPDKQTLAEIAAYSCLPKHDHVLQCFGFDVHSGPGVWLVLAYCDAGTLSRHVLDTRPDLPALLGYMHDMSSGLRFLHANNIVHRDLKSENVLMTSAGRGRPNSGGKLTCQLADLGLATFYDPDGTPGAEEYLRSRVGTPYFTAPEIWRGRYTNKADIFSLGLVFYVLFTRTSIAIHGAGVQPVLAPYLLANGTRQPIATGMNFNIDIRPQLRATFADIPDVGRLVCWMLEKDFRLRPDAQKVFSEVRSAQVGQANSTMQGALLAASGLLQRIQQAGQPITVDGATGFDEQTEQKDAKKDSGVDVV